MWDRRVFAALFKHPPSENPAILVDIKPLHTHCVLAHSRGVFKNRVQCSAMLSFSTFPIQEKLVETRLTKDSS